MTTLYRIIPVALAIFILGACVPSPTATPPRQTPFPTLPLPTITLTPQHTLTEPPTVVPSSTTSPPSTTPTVALPIATAAPQATPTSDVLPPIIQLIAQDADRPISVDEVVGLNLIAADNMGIAKVELYDNDVLYMRTTAPDPAPKTLSNSLNWKSETTGKHRLRALAFDLAGNSSTPAEIEVMVIKNNRPPQVMITEPVGSKDAQVGAPLLIQGVATDDAAVTRVDLFVDNQIYTYISPQQPGGITPFAFGFQWTPSSTGSYNITVRAHDNQDQTDDSLRLPVHVFNSQPPVVTARVERDSIPIGDALLVHAVALSANGISRIELWVDGTQTDTVNSSAPATQTVLDTQLVWSGGTEGTHRLYVRAFDSTGESADSPQSVVVVNPAGVHPSPPTPVSSPSETPAVMIAAPTSTPALVLPAAPTAEVVFYGDPRTAQLPGPFHVTVNAHGAVELDHVELWSNYAGEVNSQLLSSESGKGTTDKTLEHDWTPPRAGVAYLYARVVDNLGQTRESTPVTIYLNAAPAPTPTPAEFDFARSWQAPLAGGKWTATFTQFGNALRGVFLESHADSSSTPGTIVSGAVDKQHVTFGVDFPSPHSLDFDCLFTDLPPSLACNYTDELGARGSAIFTPVTLP